MKEEFIIKRQGKDFVLFAGLLDEAHQKGLRSISTQLVQIPTDENGGVCIVTATVTMGDGMTFSGIGDASAENVSRNIAPHSIRMAETRAKARALRDAVNVGVASVEELSGDEADDTPARAVRSPQKPAGRNAGRTQDGENTNSNVTQMRGGAKNAKAPEPGKARKSDVERLRYLSGEIGGGEQGVERAQQKYGTFAQMTRKEAADLIASFEEHLKKSREAREAAEEASS